MTESNGKKRQAGLAERIYQALKNDIFDFRLMPGEHFSENEISERMAASRTPVRQALFWLEHEGYVQVYSRSGWQVRPFDFTYFEALYDFRIVLEMEAVKRLARLLNCNFSSGLIFLTLKYSNERLPGSYEAAQAEAAEFLRRVRRDAKRYGGAPLRYIATTANWSPKRKAAARLLKNSPRSWTNSPLRRRRRVKWCLSRPP